MFMSMCCFSFLWQWLLVASKHCLPSSCFCQHIQPRNPELQEGYYKCPECTCWFGWTRCSRGCSIMSGNAVAAFLTEFSACMWAVILALETWFLCLLIQICVAVFFIYRIRNDSSLQYSKISVNSGQKCNLELPEFFPRTFPISQMLSYMPFSPADIGVWE